MVYKFTLIFFCIRSFVSVGQTFIEDFEDLSSLSDWYFLNNSDAPNENWGYGNTDNFNAYDGSSFLGVGYESSNAIDPVTISNWAISPSRTLNNGDIITFYSRRINFTPVFPDRLEVRMSTSGNSIYTGFSAENPGDFTTLLLSINPNLTSTGYPSEWTQYTVIISGLTAPINGRIAFRYFVPDGGPGGSNSNYIGIDSFTYYSSLEGPENDECETAIELEHSETCTLENGSLQVATESIPGCNGSANNDVWYAFTANTNAASIEIIGSSELDAVVEIYAGTCDNLNSLACINNGYGGDTEATVSNNLLIGNTYYVRIYDWNDWVPNTMDFTICIESFEQCAISPNINSTIEAEPCGENENGGCYEIEPSYQDASCGESIYGSTSMQNGIKDYDWYRFAINDPGTVNIMVNSEFPITLELFNIANCNIPQIVAASSFNACQQNTLTTELSEGIYSLVISPTTNNTLSCNEFNHYEINFGLPLSDVFLDISSDTISFCEGTEFYISSNQMGGSFAWILNNDNISTEDSVSLQSSGLLFLDYTNNNACSSNYSDSVTIILNSTNQALFDYGSSVLCNGDGLVENDNFEIGQYISEPGLDIDTLTGEINTNISTPGDYTITHLTIGPCPDTSMISLTIGTYSEIIFELPTNIVCDTSLEIYLDAIPFGGFFDGNGVDGNVFDPSIAGIGLHQLSYSYNNQGCISSEIQEIIVDDCSSLNELGHKIKIWPNPFQDKINIELPINTKYSVINIQGKVIENGFYKSDGILELMLSNFDPGMYYITFESNSNRTAIPVVKK